MTNIGMTRTQFERLSTLAKVRDTPSLKAARLVLLAGIRPGEAARESGTTPQALSNVLRKIKASMSMESV
jgi:hypothetical protein